MISNWVKKRAKYLLRGIRDLLDDVVPVDLVVADKARWKAMPTTAQNVLLLLNPMVEKQRYQAMLHAPVPTPSQASMAPLGGASPTQDKQPVHRDKITLADVMGHPLVQPFRHATSLGKPTRNPSYLPSIVFARTMVDLLTPGAMEPTLGDVEAGVRALDKSPQLQQSLTSLFKTAEGEFDAFMRGLQVWFDRQMDRVTGSYKRWAKRWVIVIAIVVVCVGNIDSIAIARALHASGAVRAIVVQQANEPGFCSAPGNEAQCAAEAADFLETVGIPLGWSAPNLEDGIWG